jgi:hypothetical protein
LEVLLSQPGRPGKPNALKASNRISFIPRRFLHSQKQNAIASAVPGNNGVKRSNTAEIFEVLTLNVETMFPEDVTAAGAKVKLAPVGKPEQLNARS